MTNGSIWNIVGDFHLLFPWRFCFCLLGRFHMIFKISHIFGPQKIRLIKIGWNFTWMKIQFNCLSWEIIAINIPLNISLRDISIVKHDWIVVRLESIQFMPLLNGSLRKEYFVVVVVVVVYRNYSVCINLNNFSFFSVSIRVRNLLTSSWGALNKSYASNLLFSLSCLRIMEKGVCCLLYWIRWVCKWKI